MTTLNCRKKGLGKRGNPDRLVAGGGIASAALGILNAMAAPITIAITSRLACIPVLLIACMDFSSALELPAAPLAALESDEFQIREKGQAELLEWSRERPQAAMDELFRKSRSAEEPEVRERCTEVLRELVNDEYLKEGEGFIGIRMQDEMANVPGDPKPRIAIRVIQVVPDSAAHKAGLKINDLIVGFDDKVWRAGSALIPFSDGIRQIKPGTRVTLRVVRDKQLIDVVVILDRRPLIADNPFLDERQVDVEAAEQAAREAYFRRWLERRKLRD